MTAWAEMGAAGPGARGGEWSYEGQPGAVAWSSVLARTDALSSSLAAAATRAVGAAELMAPGWAATEPARPGAQGSAQAAHAPAPPSAEPCDEPAAPAAPSLAEARAPATQLAAQAPEESAPRHVVVVAHPAAAPPPQQPTTVSAVTGPRAGAGQRVVPLCPELPGGKGAGAPLTQPGHARRAMRVANRSCSPVKKGARRMRRGASMDDLKSKAAAAGAAARSSSPTTSSITH